MPKCILAEQGGKGGGSTVVLKSIEITTPPSKTTYLSGETFDPAGMIVTATYAIGNAPIAETEVTGYAISPTILADGVTQVVITYSEGGITCTAKQNVTVTHRLTKIAVTTSPTKTNYEYGDTLATADMVVTATYSDNTTATVSGYTCSPTALNTVTSSQAITVSYTENGITQTTSFNVVVNRKSVTKPTWKTNLTYNGSAQSVTATTAWNNYNTTYMTIKGTTSATNAGTYTATFALKSNYRWSDGTITDFDVNWTIAKASGTLSLDKSSIAITGSNYSTAQTITLSGNFDGTVSITPTSVTGLTTLSLSGRTITIKGDGKTNISSVTITVKVSAGTNYTAPTDQTFTISAQYWEWGAENADAAGADISDIGDETWWAGLKNYIDTLDPNTEDGIAALEDMLGKTKTVVLSSAVQGTTRHLIMCIGYNIDRDKNNPTKNTLTFQTANCLANAFKFNNGSQDMTWPNSYARTLCQNYYNAFPGKNSVVTVSKGTCITINNNQVGTPTYYDETAFLPSDCEMGFPPGQNYNEGKGYAASYDEFCEYNTNKKSYQWYNSNERRIKKLGDSGNVTNYWERSLGYNSTTNACFVGSDGKPHSHYYNGSIGLAPALAV